MHGKYPLSTTLAIVALVATCASFARAATDAGLETTRELDRSPRWNEKPPAPADGATVKLDPPAFVWLPLRKRPDAYVLEVSRSADFAKTGTGRVEKVPISVHVPTEPLGAGRWFWRVGVRLSNGRTAWGRSQSFTIAKGAETWPLPKIDDLVAKIPRRHPRLFLPGDKLARARAGLSGGMRREYAALLRAAERCLDKPLVAEPDYLKIKKGPQRGAEYCAIFRATRPPMDKMETCGLAYMLSGQKRFGLEAKRRLLHFFAWDPEGSTSLFHNDEPAMWVMQRGVRAYDWTYDLFTPAERAKIEPVMKARCEQFLKRLTRMPFESRPYSSHAARDVGFLGEAAICFIHEWPEARQWLEYVTTIYWSVYPAWAQEDGGWQEGPGYWRAYMSFALHFVTALRQATGADLMRKPFFRNTPYYKLYSNPPYARMSPFGDGQHGPPGRGAGQLMYQFSTLLGDPCVRWYADAQRSGPGSGVLGFALYDPALEPKAPDDLPQARLFAGAGIVAMHDRLSDPRAGAYLVMRSSPMGSISHGHADQNAFALEAYGEALAIASGYYPWYGSSHHGNWTRETKAKNCVTIDGGQGQTKRSFDANGRISHFFTGKQFDYAVGDATAAYSGRLTKFLRHVVHVRPCTFVIVDELETPKPVTFEWWLHALEEMKVDRTKARVVTQRGNARLRTTFIRPRELAFDQTGKFDPPPENGARGQWHLTASTKGKRTSAVFFVVLQAHLAGAEAPALARIGQDDTVGVAFTTGGKRHEITFSPEGIRVDGNAVPGLKSN